MSLDEVEYRERRAQARGLQRALEALRDAFRAPPFETMPLDLCPLLHDGLPLRDIHTEVEAQATFSALYRLVKDLKREGRQIHFSIAGGRCLTSP